MKHSGKRFKTLYVALKELEKFFRDGRSIKSGRPLRQFGGMLPREAVANLLVCIAANEIEALDLTFVSDPTGGSDGYLWDRSRDVSFPMEHVMALEDGTAAGDAEKAILKAIGLKNAKGARAYASGKTLVVLAEGCDGKWRPNRIADNLPRPLNFEAVWVVALQSAENGEYVYGVTCLHANQGNVPTAIVRINSDFTGWTVQRLQ